MAGLIQWNEIPNSYDDGSLWLQTRPVPDDPQHSILEFDKPVESSMIKVVPIASITSQLKKLIWIEVFDRASNNIYLDNLFTNETIWVDTPEYNAKRGSFRFILPMTEEDEAAYLAYINSDVEDPEFVAPVVPAPGPRLPEPMPQDLPEGRPVVEEGPNDLIEIVDEREGQPPVYFTVRRRDLPYYLQTYPTFRVVRGAGKIRKCQGSGKYQDELLRLLRASPAYNNPATRDEAQRTHDIYVRRLKLEGPSTHGFFKKTNTDTKDDLIRQFRDELARITHTQTRIDRANAIRATYDAYIAARDAYAADPTNEELYATAYAAYETATRAFREANPSVNLAPSEAPSGPPRAPPPIPPRRGPPPAPPPRAPREDYERPNTPAQNLAEIRAFFAGIENKATALEAIRRIAPLMPQIRDQIQAGQIDVTPFKKQAKKALLNLHPDKGGDETTFQELINMLGESHGLNLYGNAKPRKCRKCHGYKY